MRTYSSPSPSPYTLPVNYSVSSNGATSTRTGTMTVAGNTFTVTQAAPPGDPIITTNPTSLNFGLVSKYRPKMMPLTVSNTGTGPLTISSIAFEGINAGHYRQTNDCSTVDPGGSCTINVTFAPTIVNLQLNAYLVINSNDADKTPLKVLCLGKGANY